LKSYKVASGQSYELEMLAIFRLMWHEIAHNLIIAIDIFSYLCANENFRATWPQTLPYGDKKDCASGLKTLD
jgi:hypothetical protein